MAEPKFVTKLVKNPSNPRKVSSSQNALSTARARYGCGWFLISTFHALKCIGLFDYLKIENDQKRPMSFGYAYRSRRSQSDFDRSASSGSYTSFGCKCFVYDLLNNGIIHPINSTEIMLADFLGFADSFLCPNSIFNRFYFRFHTRDAQANVKAFEKAHTWLIWQWCHLIRP